MHLRKTIQQILYYFLFIISMSSKVNREVLDLSSSTFLERASLYLSIYLRFSTASHIPVERFMKLLIIRIQEISIVFSY